jgi:hypothetical protein
MLNIETPISNDVTKDNLMRESSKKYKPTRESNVSNRVTFPGPSYQSFIDL